MSMVTSINLITRAYIKNIIDEFKDKYESNIIDHKTFEVDFSLLQCGNDVIVNGELKPFRYYYCCNITTIDYIIQRDEELLLFNKILKNIYG